MCLVKVIFDNGEIQFAYLVGDSLPNCRLNNGVVVALEWEEHVMQKFTVLRFEKGLIILKDRNDAHIDYSFISEEIFIFHGVQKGPKEEMHVLSYGLVY